MTALAIKTVNLPMSIVAATATIEEIQVFAAKTPVSCLTKRDNKLLQYAYARAVYRAGFDLTVEQVALLAETSVDKVLHYAQKLKIRCDEMLTNNAVSRIMCNMMQ